MKLYTLLALALVLAFPAHAEQSLFSAKYQRKFFLGLKPHVSRAMPSTQYLDTTTKVPNDLYWPDRFPLPAGLPYDQAQCGSCVVNSINGNVTYNLAIRGLLTNANSPLSRGQTMECNPSAGQCEGDWAENVGGWVGSRGHLLPEAVYSYRPQDGSCRSLSGTEFGPIPEGKVIDNSAESIGKALALVGPVSTTVGADNSWMNAGKALYTACTQQGTNHEVLIIGIHARNAARGADGFINFAAAKPGDITLDILNSWGDWADHGVIHTVMLDSRGRRCNNVTEEIYAFDWPLLAQPVDGGWSNWSPWSDCTDGKQTHTRVCTNPAPSGGGKDCVGSSSETQACATPVPPTPTPTGGMPWWAFLLIGLGGGAILVLLLKK